MPGRRFNGFRDDEVTQAQGWLEDAQQHLEDADSLVESINDEYCMYVCDHPPDYSDNSGTYLANVAMYEEWSEITRQLHSLVVRVNESKLCKHLKSKV
jgi:hypothetical protein